MMNQDILFTRRGSIAEVVFNRPDARNAATADMLIRMREFAQEVEADSSVRCFVIRGEGKHFMAGGDVKAFEQVQSLSPDQRTIEFEARVQAHAPLFTTLARMPQIVVTVMRGAVAGAGVSLAAFSDIAIAARSAFFLSAQIRLGMSPDGGATYFLPRHIGLARAKQMALMGDRISAEQAEQWGLIGYVVDDDALDAKAAEIIGRIANGPTTAMSHTKALLNGSLNATLAEQLQSEAEAFADCAGNDDFLEGFAAFVGKREPRF
jgi:2-(1,2-epoxy-1,2-dihydrophenyl)acetyl-CoA isomerase